MCDPISMSAAAAAAGSKVGLKAFAAYQGAKAERDQANYQAAIAENNATLAEGSATDAILRGGEAANIIRRQGRKTSGTQRAAIAAGGVDIKTGVAAQVVDETDFFSELDATTARNNAAREAWGFRSEAQDYRSNAKMARAVAKSKSPGRAAALSILGDAADIGAKMFGAM